MKKCPYAEKYESKIKENMEITKKALKDKSGKEYEDLMFKIKNYCEKFNRNEKNVIEKIEEDEMFLDFFLKDPSKQNFYENTAFEYLAVFFENIKRYSNKEIFIDDNTGEITSKRGEKTKSIDGLIKIKDKHIYLSVKYAAVKGGHQDNQYNDILNFLNTAQLNNRENEIFVAITDGDYFLDKIDKMQEKYNNGKTFVFKIEDFVVFFGGESNE